MDRGKRSEPAELLAVLIIGLLLKFFAGRSSLTENGILLPGYDEFYHMRRIIYTANHFPNTLWFDSYLNFPYGLDITWPPLFDQISAAFSLALGGRSYGGMEMAAATVPMIIGLIAIAAIYYLVRELFDSKVALMAGFMTAIAPYYLIYTMLGATDHHCLEVLLQLLSLLFIVMAFSRREKRYPFAALAGVMMAAMAYCWQGADIYLGMFLIYAFFKITLDLKNGSSSRENVTTLLAAFGVALILVLPSWSASWMYASFLGLATILAGLAIMHAFSLLVAERRFPWTVFPVGLIVLFILIGLLSTIGGGLFEFGAIMHHGINFVIGGEMIGKISEAEPLIYDAQTLSDVAYSGLGLNLLLSLSGAAAIIAYIRRSNEKKRPGLLLLLIWAAYSLFITFGQNRFLYLSTISMGVLISVLFFWVLDLLNRKMAERGKSTPRILVVLLLLLIVPTLQDTITFAQNTPPDVAGDWYQSLAWLKENSNTTSFYDNPSQNGEYSVMSWWDYGNWILLLANRPVVANNFQAGLEAAAQFYLSESEDDAANVLDKRGCKYVFVDFDLVYRKLEALTTWANKDIHNYMKMELEGSRIMATPQPRLLNTTLANLYFYDCEGMGRFRLIYESPTFLGDSPAKSKVKIFEYVPGALIRVRTNPGYRVGALLNMTSNQGRSFIYVNEAVPKGDTFDMRVSYSTENRYEVHAVNPYLIFAGNEAGVKRRSLNVSENDILQGRVIEVSL
ncbi:Dolichyl-monophosphooligosaccharide--protein glycotransferase AglB [uncultured archaeon]|nr:Dolichyl-monophosphooligosaccharide--protein glycotransferase AglB [uncultured archaeon]